MLTNSTETNPASKPSLPPFSGTTLEQVLQFVLPEDVARASMVCTTWRDAIKPQQLPNSNKETDHLTGAAMNTHAIWKQAVINSSPNVMQAIIEASGGEKAAASQQIDFHALAKSGLGRKRKKPELPEPTFRIEDLLIVMELKQKKVIKDENGEEKILVKSLGTFSCNGSEDMLQKDACGNVEFDLKNMPGIVLEGQNSLCPETYNGDNGELLWKNAISEFHSSLTEPVNRGHFAARVIHPIELAGIKVLDQLVVSVTLFRRDDWRSFCLLEDIQLEDGGHDRPEHFEAYGWPVWGGRHQSQPHNGSSPFARNGPGSVAHEVLESKEIRAMDVMVNITYDCVLPPPGAPEESAWLEQLRRTWPEDMEWTEQLDDDIAQVKTFQFCLDSVSLNLGEGYSEDRGSIAVDDPNAFLLLLEGLDWK